MNIQPREGNGYFTIFLRGRGKQSYALGWIEVGNKMKTKGKMIWGLYTPRDQKRSKNFSEDGGELLVLAQVDISMNSHNQAKFQATTSSIFESSFHSD